MPPSGPFPATPPRAADPIRVMIAKVGLDGHDRGAKVVARCLRDAGMDVVYTGLHRTPEEVVADDVHARVAQDVVYTGLHRTPEEVVAAAVQEDVDVLGVSLLSGAHMTLIPRIVALMRAADAGDMLLVVGGVIPDEDVPALCALGAADVILQDTPPEVVARRVRALVAARQPRR